jgi:hypothetical protein
MRNVAEVTTLKELPKLGECFATQAVVRVRTRFDVRTGL